MSNIRELVALGKQHFENKDYARSEQYLHKVLDLDVKYADVYNMLGVIAHSQGKFASAIEHFSRALEINPCYTEATLNLAVLYNDLGQYADAKKLYGDLKRHTSKSQGNIEPVLRGKLSNLHADIGDIYRSIGLHSHATEEYQKALNLNPDYFDIRTKLGQALREDGRLEESLKELKKVLKADPDYSQAFIQEGITLYAMNRIPDAIKRWTDALDRDPNNKYAQMYIRLCEAMSKMDDEGADSSVKAASPAAKGRPSRGKRGKGK